MPDMQIETRQEAHFEKYGTLPPGTRVQIIVGAQTIFDRTVPAGKKAVARIALDAEIQAA